MSWASKRETTTVEDLAYCLMGMFGINMPLLYGEGERAFTRLQEEIMKVSDDHSLFAWKSSEKHGGLLATSPAAFFNFNEVIPFNPSSTLSGAITVNNKGIQNCFSRRWACPPSMYREWEGGRNRLELPVRISREKYMCPTGATDT